MMRKDGFTALRSSVLPVDCPPARVVFAFALLVVSSTGNTAERPPVSAAPPIAQLTLDWPALAERVVQHLALVPGERVLSLCAGDRFQREFEPHLRYAVMKAGGVDLGCLEVLAEPLPQAFDPQVIQRGTSPAREALRGVLRDVDAAVMLAGAAPKHPAYAALQDLLRQGNSARRTVHFHWEGGGQPSAVAIAGQPLPPQHLIDAVYQRAVLREDCAAIGAAQRRVEAALRRGEVRVKTPLGTDLRFRVGDRPMNLQDGDASAARARTAKVLVDREVELPCGVLRVAPLEESVSGIIAYPVTQWDGRPVEGLKLHFEKGRVTRIEAAAGREAVEAALRSGGPGSEAFREFALGFNPELAVPERNPWIPYYGYGSGVVRLALGDNTELGGNVTSGRPRWWDLFVDTTVSVGDTVLVRSGKLTGP